MQALFIIRPPVARLAHHVLLPIPLQQHVCLMHQPHARVCRVHIVIHLCLLLKNVNARPALLEWTRMLTRGTCSVGTGCSVGSNCGPDLCGNANGCGTCATGQVCSAGVCGCADGLVCGQGNGPTGSIPDTACANCICPQGTYFNSTSNAASLSACRIVIRCVHPRAKFHQ